MLRLTKKCVCCTKASNVTKVQPLCHTDSDVEAHNSSENKESPITPSPQNDQCPVTFQNLEIKW